MNNVKLKPTKQGNLALDTIYDKDVFLYYVGELFQAQEKLGQIDETIKSYKLALKHNADNAKV